MHREKLIELEGAEVIALDEYGDANGVPVIFCHGWRSSSTCGTYGHRRFAPALSVDDGTTSNPTATFANILLSGTAGSVIAAPDPSSSAALKNAIVAAVRR